MRKSGGLIIPLTLIILYYGFWVGTMSYALSRFPILHQYFPIGGVSDLAASGADVARVVVTFNHNTNILCVSRPFLSLPPDSG